MDSEERKLWTRYGKARAAKTRTRLRNELVELYLPIAARMAARYSSQTPSMVEYDDIYSAGYQGLLDAIPRYNPERGVRAATFLQFRVAGAICDFLRASDSMPRLYRQRMKRVEQWEQEQLGRTATVDEIDEYFGFRLHPLNVISLDKQVYESDSGKSRTIQDKIADQHADNREGAGGLAYLLRGLSQRERLIVLLYHVEKNTMKQIGEQLGLSESRVSQMMSGLIERVRSNAA